MKLVFAGTPGFAVPALDALHGAGHEIAAVFTQPDRPAGRGRRLTASPVAERAAALGLTVHRPERLDAAAAELLRRLAPDAMVVVAYGQILRPEVLAIPRQGCFNIHASLLPRWRGAAPIARAVLAGDAETGIGIMRMDAGLDTGPVVLQQKVVLGATQTAGELHDVLAPLGAQMMVEALSLLVRGALQETPQPEQGVTYARKLSKEEARLDWPLPAEDLARRVRGFNPQPGAWSVFGAERVRVLRAQPEAAESAAAPGTVLAADAEGLRIATGAGALHVTQLQWPGGRPLAGREMHAGRDLPGRRFE